jgi:hypothetical protein
MRDVAILMLNHLQLEFKTVDGASYYPMKLDAPRRTARAVRLDEIDLDELRSGDDERRHLCGIPQ